MCELSAGAANRLLQRADLAGLGWPLPADLDADGLRERPSDRPSAGREALAFAAIHTELSRRKSVTLRQLWREYQETRPDGYG